MKLGRYILAGFGVVALCFASWACKVRLVESQVRAVGRPCEISLKDQTFYLALSDGRSTAFPGTKAESFAAAARVAHDLHVAGVCDTTYDPL